MSVASTSYSQPHPTQVLSAYLEPFARGRRVAVLGDATLGLAERLLGRGARSASVYDVDAGRVAEALAKAPTPRLGNSPSFTALSGDHALREAAFDLVVVADLGALGAPEEAVQAARRLLGPGSGVAVFVSPNPEATRWLVQGGGEGALTAPGYYELYDAVAARFADVRMLGQAPFVGYALVDFSEADPEVSIDTSLLEEPELPEWYVAIASDRALSLDAYAIVELPLEEVAAAREAGQSREPVTLPGDRTQAAGARATIDEQAVALTEARTRISVLTTEIERLREASAEVQRAARAREQLELRTAELERALDAARVSARDAELALADEKTRAGDLGAEILRLEEELSRQRAKVARDREGATAASELATAKARIVKLEAELDEVEAERDAILARADELEAKLDAVEPPTLRSRESAIKLAALEAKLGEVEAALRAATESDRSAQQRAKEAAARADKAERELTAAQTVKAEALRQAKDSDARHGASAQRIGALEAELAEARAARDEASARAARLESELALAQAAPKPAAPSGEEEKALARAHADEIDALEASLRASGARVAELGRELREAERVGRELLFELETLRGGSKLGTAAGGASTSNGGGARPGSQDLARAHAAAEELAERAARAEADLVASNWRVAQLERSLALHAPAPTGGDDPRLSVLERALAHAQRELAELRAAGARGGSSAALEQAVLLDQVERHAAEAERPR